MPNSLTTSASLAAQADDVAPGVGLLSIERVAGQRKARVTATPPTVDSDGSELTGVTAFQGHMVPLDSNDPVIVNLDEAAAAMVPGAQVVNIPLSPNGSPVFVDYVIAFNTPYSVIGHFTDDVVAPV